jgi:hypothetical protein
MLRLACVCFFLVTAAAGTAHAQGLYLPNQTSGIGVVADVDYNQDAFGVGLGAGYSYKAFIDGGVVVHRYGYTTSEANLTSIGVQPYVNAHLIRQSDSVPVSVAATGNFQQYFYSIDTDNRDVSGYSFFLGGAAYRRFGLSDTVSVTPQATLGYDFIHTHGARGLVKLGSDAGSLLFQAAANIGFQSAGGGTIWALNPFMTVDSNYVTFGLGFGATFPVSRR